jgi:large subunit ribosomal protein L27
MAHKKGQGSSRNGRDSNPQHRGIKVFAGQTVTPGSILVRQVGSKFTAGHNVRMGRDFTLFSVVQGKVEYRPNRSVHVKPTEEQPAAASTVGAGTPATTPG